MNPEAGRYVVTLEVLADNLPDAEETARKLGESEEAQCHSVLAVRLRPATPKELALARKVGIIE